MITLTGAELLTSNMAIGELQAKESEPNKSSDQTDHALAPCSCS